MIDEFGKHIYHLGKATLKGAYTSPKQQNYASDPSWYSWYALWKLLIASKNSTFILETTTQQTSYYKLTSNT